MMDLEKQLKLQAYLDGELSETDRRTVESLLAHDAEAAALTAELRHTLAALAAGESERTLPESREFYWSKIERGIRLAERRDPTPERPSWLATWRRLLVPLGTVATVTVAGLLAVSQFGSTGSQESEMALTDSDAFTYRDYAGGMTLVWLSYPAENEFAVPALGDTLD
jgi:anti-sigma factor RsiW